MANSPEDPEDVPDREESKKDFEDLGGWQAFKSGEWFFRLVARSFRNYYTHANAEYFRNKYPRKDDDFIAAKLISVAARNSMLLGGATGLAVSTDEVIGILTGGEMVVGIPANVAIAVAAMGGEAIGLVKIQLKLVASLSRVYDVPLDPDDPEDILTIIAFAIGGSAANAAGKMGMRVGGHVSEKLVRRYVTKDVLTMLKAIGRTIGVKILQRTIIKYTVPIVSVAIGAGWNYVATKSVGRTARRHLLKRKEDERVA